MKKTKFLKIQLMKTSIMEDAGDAIQETRQERWLARMVSHSCFKKSSVSREAQRFSALCICERWRER